jgi:hypothetical protein
MVADQQLSSHLFAAVNDAPTFAKGASTITVLEDSEPYSAAWAINISAGPGETDQTTMFDVACSDAALFSSQPQISTSGLLSLTPEAGKFGSSSCNLTLVDSEGARSPTEQLTIVVTAVNHAPSFKAGAATVTVAEDSAPYSAAWATNISSGPGESDPLAFTVNCSTQPVGLFAAAPSMNVAGLMAFTPAANAFGNASCTVTLTEQMAGGLSAAAPLTIVVTPGKITAL